MMSEKRRLDLRFLASLAAACAVVGTLLHAVHGYQLRRTADFLLRTADAAADSGRLQRSVDYLERYLALVPGDGDTLAKYGLLLADTRLATHPKALLRAF